MTEPEEIRLIGIPTSIEERICDAAQTAFDPKRLAALVRLIKDEIALAEAISAAKRYVKGEKPVQAVRNPPTIDSNNP